MADLLRHAQEVASELEASAVAEAERITTEARRLEAEARLLYDDARQVRDTAQAHLVNVTEQLDRASEDAVTIVADASEQATILVRDAEQRREAAARFIVEPRGADSEDEQGTARTA